MDRSEEKRPVGRPTRIDDGLIGRVVGVVLGGATRRAAANVCGINEQLFRLWMRRGKAEPDTIYEEFRNAILTAESQAEVGAASNIYQAGFSDPKYHQWWLTKRCKDWKDKPGEGVEKKANPIEFTQGEGSSCQKTGLFGDVDELDKYMAGIIESAERECEDEAEQKRRDVQEDGA